MFDVTEGSEDGKFSSESIKTLFKQVGIINKDTGITEADVDAAFAKTCKVKNGLGLVDYKEFIKALAEEKKVELKELFKTFATSMKKKVFEMFDVTVGSEDGKFSSESIKMLFKQVSIISKDTGITEADVDSAFAKTCKDKKGLEFGDYKEFIKALAEEKKLVPKEIFEMFGTAMKKKVLEMFDVTERSEDGKFSSESIKMLFKQVGIISKDTGITEADVDAVFAKTCKDKRGLEFGNFKEFIKALAEEKKDVPKELFETFATAMKKKVLEMFDITVGSEDGKFSSEAIKMLFKQVGIISKDTGITEADVDAAFSKTCKDKKGLEFGDYKEFIMALAEEKKVEPKELFEMFATADAEEAAAAGGKHDKDEK